MSEVDDHLETFKKYLTIYKDMLESACPSGLDVFSYSDFDSYMTKLDPVSGYLENKFGKDKADELVKDFLFSYAY